MEKSKARSAVLWSSLDVLVRYGLTFIILTLLARLLTPEDFGTIALISLFIGLAKLFIDAGFSQALIQKQETTLEEESTVFWFNLCAAFFVLIMLFSISVQIAEFFALPILSQLTQFMAVNLLLSALGTIHVTLLTKQLDFKTPMKTGLLATLISGCIAIYLAWNGYGVWALVVQTIVGTLVNTLLLWYLCPWRPLYYFNIKALRKLLDFGGWLFVSSLLDTIYQRGYVLLIGKFYGTYNLGIYNNANYIQQMPTGVISSILFRITFPLFSSISHDKEQLRTKVRQVIRSVMLVSTPVMVGLATVADLFIPMLFGEQWLTTIPILQVLCLIAIIHPLQIINLQALKAQGHSRIFFKIEVIKKIFGTTLLLIGSFFGIIGIAWGRVASSIIALAINSYYTKKLLNYGACEQLKDCLPSITISIIMGLVLASIELNFIHNNSGEFFILIIAGVIFYITINFIFNNRACKEFFNFIRRGY